MTAYRDESTALAAKKQVLREDIRRLQTQLDALGENAPPVQPQRSGPRIVLLLVVGASVALSAVLLARPRAPETVLKLTMGLDGDVDVGGEVIYGQIPGGGSYGMSCRDEQGDRLRVCMRAPRLELIGDVLRAKHVLHDPRTTRVVVEAHASNYRARHLIDFIHGLGYSRVDLVTR